ncbi:MAG TPA: hypothetical protein VGG03_20280 [Thermoanaerobaculia bacterium]|jgi:hypothetical protein
MRRLVIPAVVALIGVGGLAALDHSSSASFHDTWYYHILLHLGSLFGTVGLVGLLFELFFRKGAMEDFVQLFTENPRLAESLSREERQKRVKDTLLAQLGPELGEAVHDGAVSRYFSEQAFFRKQFEYEVDIFDLTEDRLLKGEGDETVVLSKEHYYRLKIRAQFHRPLPTCKEISFGCIWIDDFRELNAWFSDAACIFRDTITLRNEDKEPVRQFFARTGRSRQAAGYINSLFSIENLSIGGVKLHASSVKIRKEANSAGVYFKLPRELRSTRRSDLVSYQMTVSGLIDKETRKYPVILVEPTRDPRIVIRWNTLDITRIVPAPFFTGTRTFEPQIEEDPEPEPGSGRIGISFAQTGEKPAWVLPGSGVIFLWERKGQ